MNYTLISKSMKKSPNSVQKISLDFQSLAQTTQLTLLKLPKRPERRSFCPVWVKYRPQRHLARTCGNALETSFKKYYQFFTTCMKVQL